MKNIFFAVWLLGSSASYACDNCNVYLGINPNDFNHSVQLLQRWSWRYGTFNNQGDQILKHGGSSKFVSSDVFEIYTTYELRGRVFLNPRLSLLASVPFKNNYRAINEVTTTDVYGLGDPITLINYRILNSKITDSSRVQHQLTLIGGVKLPLGKSDAVFEGDLVDHDMQLGSGSFDFISGIEYYLKYKSLGMNFAINNKINTVNTDKFRYGNRLNLVAGFFGSFKIKKTKFLPHLGTYSEFSSSDSYQGQLIEDSPVTTHFIRSSIGVFIKRWSLSVEGLLPASQKIGEKNLKEGYRFRFGLSYFLK